MNIVNVNLDALSESARTEILSIINTAEPKKDAHFPAVQDGDTFTMAGMEWIKFPSVNGQIPIVAKNIAFCSRFGDYNDLRSSDVLRKLEAEILPKVIEAVGRDNLCTIHTDLTTLDGLKPYGTMESLISIPTFDFYRANAEIFGKHKPNCWWWLATPKSAQPNDDPYWISCVSPSGVVYVGISCSCNDVLGVRPFLILKSTIFVSSAE